MVTSRSDFAGLVPNFADGLKVDLLGAAEAQEFFARRLGRARVEAEPGAVAGLVELCVRLPLALAIVAARAAAVPALPLAAIERELRDERHRLDVLATGEDRTSIGAVFSWSYRALSPEAARLFRLLGLHPGPDIAGPAASRLAEVEEPRGLLNELVRAHLLEVRGVGRYQFHDLLRVYAAQQAGLKETEKAQREAVSRVLDFYPETAPDRDTDWFDGEVANLLAAVRYVDAHTLDKYAGPLAATLSAYLNKTGRVHDYADIQHVTLNAARRAGDVAGQALARRNLGGAYSRMERSEEAVTELRRALALFRKIGDAEGQARSYVMLSWEFEGQRRHVEAAEYARQAHEIYVAVGSRHEGDALNALGWSHARSSAPELAIDPCERAVALHRNRRNKAGIADALDSLGHARHRLGEFCEAIKNFAESADLYNKAHDRYNEADTLNSLGDCELAAGEPGAARATWSKALEILEELRHPDSEKVSAKLAALQPGCR